MPRKTKTQPSGIPGVRIEAGPFRHVNKQTYGANASTAIGEAIQNPAYGRAGIQRGMLVVGVMMIPEPGAGFAAAPSVSGEFVTQVQIGDQSGTPALSTPQDDDLFAHMEHLSAVATNGGQYGPKGPFVVTIINVLPVIVEQNFTVVHQAENHASYNSKDVYTIIDYYTAMLDTDVYTSILLSRRDES